MRELTKMATEANMRIPGALFGTTVDPSTIASDASNAPRTQENDREGLVRRHLGAMRVTGANHSTIVFEADEFEIAAVRFFREFIHTRYCHSANIRATENASLCQMFEELFRRTHNEITLFLEDLESGKLDTDYDLSDALRVVGQAGFECVIAGFSQTLPPTRESHLAYLLKLREEMRIGFAEATSILLRRSLNNTSPIVGRILAHATITVLSQLFELEKSYCSHTNRRFKPIDEGRFLTDAAA